MKKLLKIVASLLVLAILAAILFFYSIFISVEHLKISYETIISKEIPQEMHNITIGFLSDLEYDHYMNKERLTKIIDSINQASCDVIIFGGDIFYQSADHAPTDATKQEIIQLLKEIQAPLGKFAVLGEQDRYSEDILAMTKDILFQSDFELLQNRSIIIRNGSKDGIRLVGIDSFLNDAADFTFLNPVPSDAFNLLVTHCPDTVFMDGFPTDKIDLALAGHSHSSQIYLPFFNAYRTQEGASVYNHGYHIVEGMPLHITNGIGTAEMDMRLFSPPQLLVYRLQNEALQAGYTQDAQPQAQ